MDTPLSMFMFLNLIPNILPVSQQFPILLQLSIMFSNGVGDSFECPPQVVKCLHHQLNFSHVAGGIWNRPYVLPSELNLAKFMNAANKRQLKLVNHLWPMDFQVLLWIEGI